MQQELVKFKGSCSQVFCPKVSKSNIDLFIHDMHLPNQLLNILKTHKISMEMQFLEEIYPSIAYDTKLMVSMPGVDLKTTLIS